jgi:hypothetical protein
MLSRFFHKRGANDDNASALGLLNNGRRGPNPGAAA